MLALKRDSEKEDYGPIVGPRDPLVIKLGLVKNPVLVKDIRLLARHIRNLKPYVRVSGLIIAIAPWIGLLLYIINDLGNSYPGVTKWYSYTSIHKIIPYAVWRNCLVYTCKDIYGTFLSTIFMNLILWIVLSWRSTELFYGYDLSRQVFQLLSLSYLRSLNVLKAKMVLQLPFFLAVSVIALTYIRYMHYNIIVRVSWHTSSPRWHPYLAVLGGHNLPRTTPIHEPGIVTLAVLSITFFIAFTYTFVATHTESRFLRLIFACLLVGFYVMNQLAVSENVRWFHYIWECLKSYYISFSLAPFSLTSLFFDYRPAWRSLDSMDIFYGLFWKTLTSQVFFSLLALYGTYWNIKRRLETRQ